MDEVDQGVAECALGSDPFGSPVLTSDGIGSQEASLEAFGSIWGAVAQVQTEDDPSAGALTLDPDRGLNTGSPRGPRLVAEGAELAEEDIFKLIFEPGFSTAEQVTNLSGRGVGMDVVRRNIESLRGSVHIDSAPGQGTTIAIRLPLTLAIIDGFLTGVGDAAFVVPLDLVEECIELTGDATSRDYLNLRGEVLPFLRLREQFGVPGQSHRRQSVVVVRYAGKRAGLVVDELMGEFQTVIKPLGPVFAQLRGIAGSTILGSGDVALILDIPNLISRTASAPAERPALAS